MKILITGGSGLLGTSLTMELQNQGYTVAWLSQTLKREKHFLWNVSKKEIDKEAIEWADVIIHLAGASIAGKRWTKSYKEELYSSRIEGTRLLMESINKAMNKPTYFIAASAIGYYGVYKKQSKPFIEFDNAGNDFLARLTFDWEKEIFAFKDVIKTAAIRIGIVLSSKGGALNQMVLPAKLGLSAALGSGQQIVSWIHIDDLVNQFLFLIKKQEEGVFNGVSPTSCTNKQLTEEIAITLKRPYFLPNIPVFIVNVMLGELSKYVVLGSDVSSHKIQKLGFQFKYPEIKSALIQLLK